MIDFGVVRACSPLASAALAAAGFLAIYLGFGSVAWWASRRLLPRLGVGQPLQSPPLGQHQIGREIRASLGSVVIFGGWTLLTLLAERRGWVTILWQPRWGRVPFELAALVLWNEVHFYVVHRALHSRLLFRHVHRQHHKSLQATPFSTYAMHPIEAVLLGSVMFCLMLVLPLSPVAMLLFPMLSLSFNVLGHANYDLAPTRGDWHPSAATRRHALHHSRVAGNYGFLLPTLDHLFKTRL